MNNNDIKIGERMKHFRGLASMTQEELSLETGISQKYISEIERGRKNPTVKTIAKIAVALGISVHQFYDDNYKEYGKIDVNVDDHIEEFSGIIRRVPSDKRARFLETVSQFADLTINTPDNK